MSDLIERQKAIDAIREAGITEYDEARAIEWVEKVPSVQPEMFGIFEHLACENMSIKQAILERTDKQRADLRPDMFQQGYIGDTAYRTCADVQPEKLTDAEQRIFLTAMGREEKVCKEIDEKNPNEEPYEDSLVYVCKEIERKVKGTLWT